VFDPQGNPLEGPPAQAKQRLKSYPLRVEDGQVFVEVPLTAVGQGVASAAPRRRRHLGSGEA
jgi:hypothetical protein